MINPSVEARTAAAWWTDLLKREAPGAETQDRQIKSEYYPDLTPANLARFEIELARLIHEKFEECPSGFVVERDSFSVGPLLWKACDAAGIYSLKAFPRMSQTVIGPNSVMAKSGLGQPIQLLPAEPAGLAA